MEKQVKYNQVSFTQEEVRKGFLFNLIQLLNDQTIESIQNDESPTINDIHIDTDGFSIIVEWCQTTLDGEFGQFKYVDENGQLLK